MGFWTNERGQTTSKLTEEEYLFLKEYVDNMSESIEGSLITYTKDFILTEEHRKIISSLQNKFQDVSEDWAYEERYEKNRGEYHARLYDRDESIMYDIVDFFEKDKEFFVEIHVRCDVYNEEEDEDEDEDEEFEI